MWFSETRDGRIRNPSIRVRLLYTAVFPSAFPVFKDISDIIKPSRSNTNIRIIGLLGIVNRSVYNTCSARWIVSGSTVVMENIKRRAIFFRWAGEAREQYVRCGIKGTRKQIQ